MIIIHEEEKIFTTLLCMRIVAIFGFFVYDKLCFGNLSSKPQCNINREDIKLLNLIHKKF